MFLVCLSVSLSRRKQVLFCLYFKISDFSSPPWRKVSRRWATAFGCTVQHLAGGVPVCLFLSGHNLWFERRPWRFETSWAPAANVWSCQSPLFEVSDSYVSKQSRHIRLKSVWCWNVWEKKDISLSELLFGEDEMKTYHIVWVFTVSELVKMKK